MKKLAEFIEDYKNDAKGNDEIYTLFTQNTNETLMLKKHRDYIEKYKLGFGDRAFHFMWYEVLNDLKEKKPKPQLLEIGVYKGQVISLWALLVKELNIQAEISAISPLEGNISSNALFNNRIVNRIKRFFKPRFKKEQKEGNLYAKENYEKIISDLFSEFGLSFESIHLYKGYSNDEKILEEVRKQSFDLIYIDGDHSFEGALKDIRNFSALISKGGYLVMDDASYFLEGSAFWKGHEQVSRAAGTITEPEFKNVLNIGHNRVYQKN